MAEGEEKDPKQFEHHKTVRLVNESTQTTYWNKIIKESNKLGKKLKELSCMGWWKSIMGCGKPDLCKFQRKFDSKEPQQKNS